MARGCAEYIFVFDVNRSKCHERWYRYDSGHAPRCLLWTSDPRLQTDVLPQRVTFLRARRKSLFFRVYWVWCILGVVSWLDYCLGCCAERYLSIVNVIQLTTVSSVLFIHAKCPCRVTVMINVYTYPQSTEPLRLCRLKILGFGSVPGPLLVFFCFSSSSTGFRMALASEI